MTEITDTEKFQAINTGRCPRCNSTMHFIPSVINPNITSNPSWLTCNEFENDCTFNWEDVGDNLEFLIMSSKFKFSRSNIQKRIAQLVWYIDKPSDDIEDKFQKTRIEILSISNALGERHRPAKYIEIM